MDSMRRKSTMRCLLRCAFAVYCFLLVLLLFLSRKRAEDMTVADYYRLSNIIPFHGIVSYIRALMRNHISWNIVFWNLFGNLILFFPMGCFLPCLFPVFRKIRTVAPVLLGMILAVELLQPLLRVGFLDVDDVILNFAGAMVGVGVVRIPAVNRLLRKLYVWKEPEMQAVHKGQDL